MLMNNRGNAMIEIVPILAIFILLVNFALGFFGLIHSGILNSIGARNYAFETFRNRSDLTYIRDSLGQVDENLSFTYTKTQMRFHVVKNETDKPGDSTSFYATRRPIQFSEIKNADQTSSDTQTTLHQKIKGIVEGQRASDVVDDPTTTAWVRTAYGICLTASCGG